MADHKFGLKGQFKVKGDEEQIIRAKSSAHNAQDSVLPYVQQMNHKSLHNCLPKWGPTKQAQQGGQNSFQICHFSSIIQHFFNFVHCRDNIDDFKVQTAKHPNISSVPMRPHSEQSRDRTSKRLSTESNGTSDGGMGSSTPVEITALEESFRRFAIHGDTRATGKEMHGKNWSKLCKDCNVIDGKNVTLTDVDIVFTKVKKKAVRTITYDEFKVALGELARKKYKEKSGEEAEAEVFKLIEGKGPVIAGVTRAVASPTVSRLTDPTKFTGSHKERFDDTGRGKGKAGRVDLVDTSGYVSGYKHKGSYEKKVTKNNVGKPM